MAATVALRVEGLQEQHAAVKTETLAAATAFREEFGYRPPYWTLVKMAREALGNN
ncbi:MAG: hypothetical protein AAGF12_02195 [Myxococcota bacterium]